MLRSQFTAVAIVLSSCEPVHLQLGDPTPPPEAPASEALPTRNDPPSTCAVRCLGGRQCTEGACLPTGSRSIRPNSLTASRASDTTPSGPAPR